MIEIKNKKRENAVLAGIKLPGTDADTSREHMQELEMLADTAGADTLLKVIQERVAPDPATYLGKGKVGEIGDFIENNDVTTIIFDEDLSATQIRNLEKMLDRKIVDRSGLILDIFASHAKTRQAKTQVELAQLQYMLPRLTRAWTHLSKQYGGIGTKGPGETQIETDRRIIKTRITKLKEKLKEIESQQITKSRQRKSYLTVSIVGYTNAGKSTLMNLLTDSDVIAEDKLFATLDSTTRALEIEKGKKIILSDTVGFIRKLPHNLIESFKSTLMVAREADLIIHLIDISNPFFEDHIAVVEETLKELGCETTPQIKVFNKIDNLEDKDKIRFVYSHYEDALILSAKRGINISALHRYLLEFYERNYITSRIETNIENSKKISMIYELADVIKAEYEDDKAVIYFRATIPVSEKIASLFKE